MQGKVILLVEDNSDDVELTLRAFKKNKILNVVIVAQDGVEALDYLWRRGKYAGRESAEVPGFILLDLKLPKIGGLEVLKRLRQDERTQLVPVVVLTSSAQEEELIEAYRLGANSYVRKPVDFERFSEAIRQISHYWLLLNESPQSKERVI